MPRPVILPSTRLVPLDPVRAVAELFSVGYTSIELSYASFERAGYDHPSYLNMLRRSLLEAAKLGARVPVVHGPWEDYFLISMGRGVEHAVAEAVTVAEIAAAYGVEVLVLHPFSAKRLGYGRAAWLNKKFFGLLLDRLEAEELDIVVAVENTSRETPWTAIEQVAGLVRGLGSPRLRLCLDFGHALLNGYQPRHALAAAGGLEHCLHVHDNHGARDEHLVPGTGSAEWEGLQGVSTAARYAVVEVDCREGMAHCRARARVAVAAAGEALWGLEAGG